MSASDMQVDGDHYRKMGDAQPWDILAKWLTPEEYRGYQKGVAIAYLARELSKGGNSDIRKAAHHLQRLIEELDKQEAVLVQKADHPYSHGDFPKDLPQILNWPPIQPGVVLGGGVAACATATAPDPDGDAAPPLTAADAPAAVTGEEMEASGDGWVPHKPTNEDEPPLGVGINDFVDARLRSGDVLAKRVVCHLWWAQISEDRGNEIVAWRRHA